MKSSIMVVKMANREGAGKRAAMIAGTVSLVEFVLKVDITYHELFFQLQASHSTHLLFMRIENEMQSSEERDVQKSLQPTASPRFRDPRELNLTSKATTTACTFLLHSMQD